MSDIKALAILSDQIDNFRRLPDPPTNFDDAEVYTGTLRKTSDEAQKVVEKVKTYLERIEEKIEKLRAAQKDLIKRNQDAIQKIFSQFKPSTHFDERARKPIVEKMKAAIELEKATRELMNHRLNELIDETELVCGRVQDGAALLSDDIDGLQGCLNNWRDAKVQSYAEEKRKEDEERRRREEEEKRRMEDEMRRKKEEEERKKREEEERRKREKEEAERRAEEERRRREEEERLRREEEERRKREEEERIKRELEEKRLREEEERRRREEEQARKKEEARRRREEELREKERLRREAEEKAWRQDPNNWKPVVYERACDEVDGRKEYHGGITCVLTSPPGGVEKDDLECFASDEVDSIITVLEDDEKPVSSVIDVRSEKESLHTEVPSRLYVPHNRILSPSDEIVIKISRDGNDWMTCSPAQPTSNMSELEKTSKGLAGIEVNDFTTLKIIVVSRPKSQTIFVDRPGISVYSAVDNQVKLFVPRDTFESKTEMRMMVQTVGSDTLSGLVKDNPTLEYVLSVSSLITLLSKKSPRKSMEIDLLKASTKQAGTSRFQRGKCYQLYACRDKSWRIADVEYKGQQNNVTVSLPVGRDKITIMELEVPANVPKESVPGIAEALQSCINKTASVLVVKQKSSNPRMCAVRIIRKEDIKHIVDYLESIGFDEGPGVSGEFKIKEGQAIELICTGNIETDPEQKIELEYMSYKGGAGTIFTVRVKDGYKQKDLPSFVGNIQCLLLRNKQFRSDNVAYSIEMTISLPKPVRAKSAIGFVAVRFPYYLTSLANYLAREVRNEALCDWQAVMKTLMGEKGFEKGHRNAKRKFDDSVNDAILFKAVLLDWMKAQQRHDDKLRTVMDALRRNGHSTLAHLCEEFVAQQKECLSDAVLKEISLNATKAVRDIGRDLGLHEHVIDKLFRAQEGDTPAQIEALLIEWRETDNVLKHNDVKKHLISVCN